MPNNEYKHKPAYIEIVHPTHTYLATVYDLASLERYCSDVVEFGTPFRIGSIESYGDLDIDTLVKTLNRIGRYGTYDRTLERKDV